MIRVSHGVVLAAVTCCILSGVGIADEAETQDFTLLLHRHTWQIGPQVSYFKYKEPGIMTEKGGLYGLAGSYDYRPWVNADDAAANGGNMLRLDGRACLGQVDYDGSLLDGTPYATNGIDDSLFEVRVLAGRDFLASAHLVTLYFGLGYRYLNDDSSSDQYGYQRESNYLYVPVGVQYTREFSEGTSIAPTAEFDLLLRGRQRSHLSDADPDLHDVTNDQTSGYALRGSIRFQKRLDHFVLALDPFVTYWHVEESNHKVDGPHVVYEPRNWSVECGLRFLFTF